MAKNIRKRSGLLDTISACISLTMVLILLGTVVMFVTMARNFSQSVRENFTVEVLLDDENVYTGTPDAAEQVKAIRSTCKKRML